MVKSVFQKSAFALIAVSLLAGPLFGKPGAFTYIVLAGTLLYLFTGWYLPLIKEEKFYLGHGLAGFVYSTVMTASVMAQHAYPGAIYFVIYGVALSLALVLYMFIKRREVNRYLFMQAVVLFMLSVVPFFECRL